MFDIGWPELALIMILAILVIGPKELPLVLRTLGRWAGKIRVLIREFRSSIDEIAKESELDEFRNMASGGTVENGIAPEKPAPKSNAPVDDSERNERG